MIKKRRLDVLYVEGTGGIVEALERWHDRKDILSETSRTFSGQVFDFCEKHGLNTMAISAYEKRRKSTPIDGFSAVTIPKWGPNRGILYHAAQILYGFEILAICFWLRPRYLHITNAPTHWFMLAPLRLVGVKICAHLHNTLWPRGYPPSGRVRRWLLALDAWFFRRIAHVALCCSKEVEHQIVGLTEGKACPIVIFTAQFNRGSFEHASAPPAHEQQPFVIVFAGRIERNKGVFDLLEIAERLRDRPVVIHICGGGPCQDELVNVRRGKDLRNVIIHGKLSRPELIGVYAQGHVVIVPTRSDFPEGLAMVAAEAVLLNRPFIASSVVPAVEPLKDACIEVPADDVNAYVEAICTLMSDKRRYLRMVESCSLLREQFVDGKNGLTQALECTLDSLTDQNSR